MWYNIDFTDLAIKFLPATFRKAKIVSFARMLLSGTVAVHDSFISYRANNIYKLANNGQVCYLRKVLNDNFDVSMRRIKIVDGELYPRTYIYTAPEQRQRYFGSLFLRQSIDFEDSGVDFLVILPSGLQFSEEDMRAILDYYRLASKRYDIRYE